MKIETFGKKGRASKEVTLPVAAGKGDSHAPRMNAKAWFEAEFWKKREKREAEEK